jgi:hypothetical protein
MFGWLKNIFGMADRTEKAADRIAETMEALADDLQLVRKALRQRVGLEDADGPVLPSVAASVPGIENHTDATDAPARRNGRKARVTA